MGICLFQESGYFSSREKQGTVFYKHLDAKGQHINTNIGICPTVWLIHILGYLGEKRNMDKKTKKAADVIPVTEALKNGVQ